MATPVRVPELNRASLFRRTQWLFPIAVTIHNLEEAVWLPQFAAQHAAIVPWQPRPAGFRILVAVLSVTAFVITWLSAKTPERRLYMYVYLGYVTVLLLNVFIPHIGAAFYFRENVPGVVSAVLVVLPITTAIITFAIRERIVHTWKTAAAVFGIPFAISVAASFFFLRRII